MKQLLLIEGLPGTGKTTTAKTLAARLAERGEAVTPLLEGDAQIPGDFNQLAGIPATVFDAFRARHPAVAEAGWGIILRTPDFVFLRLDRCIPFVSAVFRPFDMGDEHNRAIGSAEYIRCALSRIGHWVFQNLNHGGITIMDSGFLQNPINELLFRKASDAEIRAFIQRYAEMLAPLHPLCIYLRRESADAAIAYASGAKGPDWTARVAALLLDTPDFFARRLALELSLLPCVPHVICDIRGDDFSDIDRQLARALGPEAAP